MRGIHEKYENEINMWNFIWEAKVNLDKRDVFSLPVEEWKMDMINIDAFNPNKSKVCKRF